MTVVNKIPDDVYVRGSLRAELSIPDRLVYWLLNVGNADTQVLLLPEENGTRHLAIVDIGRADHKVGRLVDELLALDVLSPESRVRLLVATHPHQDHVGGIPQFLRSHGHLLSGGQVWDPGYFHTTAAWHGLMTWLEENPQVSRIHPTAGTRVHFGSVAFTALAPSIRLRNNFDTYDVKLNNSSVSLLVEFPFRRVFSTGEISSGRTDNSISTQRLLLGADAQTMSWSHVDVDFHRLKQRHETEYRRLGLANGREPLRAEIFKVPHHGSKNGLNHELVLRIRPKLSLISCAPFEGGHSFPHRVSADLVREALQPIATAKNAMRGADWDKPIRLLTTGDRFEMSDDPLGSIAVVLRANGRKLFRLEDEVGSDPSFPGAMTDTLELPRS